MLAEPRMVAHLARALAKNDDRRAATLVSEPLRLRAFIGLLGTGRAS